MNRCDHCHSPTIRPLIKLGFRRLCVPCIADNDRYRKHARARFFRGILYLIVICECLALAWRLM